MCDLVRVKVWVIPLGAVLAAALLLPIVAALHCGAGKLDTLMCDDYGRYASAWIRTRDVAPGDDMVVRVATHGGYASSINHVSVRLADTTVDVDGGEPGWGSVVDAESSNQDDQTVVVTVPTTAPIGLADLDIAIDLTVATDAGGGFVNDTYADHVVVPFEILDPGARSRQRLVDRAKATLAWLVACAMAFACTRYLPRSFGRFRNSKNELVSVALLLVIMLLAMIGQLVFVRPILRTVAVSSWLAGITLLGVWCVALVVGAWVGLRARRHAPD